MFASSFYRFALIWVVTLGFSFSAMAEMEEDTSPGEDQVQPMHTTRDQKQQKQKRKYFIEDPKRIDAGVFHVGFAVGGNFYIEPKFDSTTFAPLGDNFEDFGGQGGVYFDFDYEDLRLGLRTFVGYKYILNSVHAFTIDLAARYLWKMSDKVKFGVGVGPSIALWLRSNTTQTNGEETSLVPFFMITAGFDFNPFMVDFKFPIHRIGTNSTILGMELYFGVRL